MWPDISHLEVGARLLERSESAFSHYLPSHRGKAEPAMKACPRRVPACYPSTSLEGDCLAAVNTLAPIVVGESGEAVVVKQERRSRSLSRCIAFEPGACFAENAKPVTRGSRE